MLVDNIGASQFNSVLQRRPAVSEKYNEKTLNSEASFDIAPKRTRDFLKHFALYYQKNIDGNLSIVKIPFKIIVPFIMSDTSLVNIFLYLPMIHGQNSSLTGRTEYSLQCQKPTGINMVKSYTSHPNFSHSAGRMDLFLA